MGCGCGGRKGIKRTVVKVARSPRDPIRISTVRSGVKAQPIPRLAASRSKRCPKCRWPMSTARRFTGGATILVYTCLNKKCMYREEPDGRKLDM